MHPFTAIPQRLVQRLFVQFIIVALCGVTLWWLFARVVTAGPQQEDFKMVDLQRAKSLEKAGEIMAYWKENGEMESAFTSIHRDWVFIALWSISFPLLAMVCNRFVATPWVSFLAWMLWLGPAIDLFENGLTYYLLIKFESQASLEGCPASFPWIVWLGFMPKLVIYFASGSICIVLVLAAWRRRIICVVL